MYDPHALTLGRRLDTIRRLLFRRKPYLLVKNKPDNMVLPRPPNYVLEPVRARIERDRPEIEGTLSALNEQAERFAREDAYDELRENGWFSGADAAYAYAMIRHFRPGAIIEVGSGYSTRIMRKAAQDEGYRPDRA